MDVCFSLLSEEEYDQIWTRVEEELQFHPSMQQFIRPFQVPAPWVIHDISTSLTDEQGDAFEDAVRQVLVQCLEDDSWCYALDWQHSGFHYDPRQPQEGYGFWVEDERYSGGGYNACFPGFYPDGDYYFFLQKDLNWGYLGHPWRQELWLFGKSLIEALSPKLEELGFPLKSSSERT